MCSFRHCLRYAFPCFLVLHSPSQSILIPVLSTSRWIGLFVLIGVREIFICFCLRQIVEKSGVSHARWDNCIILCTSPVVCLRGSWKSDFIIRQNWMAASENSCGLRSSSAWAKKAAAKRMISLARFSSPTSRSSCLIRNLSCSDCLLSTLLSRACLIQLHIVWGVQPIFDERETSVWCKRAPV